VEGQPRQIEIFENQSERGFLAVGTGAFTRRIAYLRRAAHGGGVQMPGVIWLGGFRSDMNGRKAVQLDRQAAQTGRAFLRFDYSGHGESEGCFEAATIAMWLEEVLAVLRALSEGPQVLVASSMGAWLALLAARALFSSGEAARLHGLVLIAPAVDFTENLLWNAMPAKARVEIEAGGVWLKESGHSAEPYPISAALIEEGRNHLLFETAIRSHCPTHILQGMQDRDVPWRHAMMLVEHLAGDPVILTLIKDGDHRLSRPEDLARIWAAVEGIG
jgi:pimeloyl-ACP methyl ester carboxylesterase